MAKEVRLKSLKCIEWKALGSGTTTVLLSKTFSILDRKCHLEFDVRSFNATSKLYFKSDKELQWAVSITTRVLAASETLKVQEGSIKSIHQEIWNCPGRDLRSVLLTVQIIIHANLFKEEKSTQMSSYKDACFSVENVSHDFSNLLEEGPDHDVEFMCGNQIVKAHKNILCSHSKVLGSMLQSDMIEGKTGKVTILDIDAAIFRRFLKHLYTGMLPELTLDSAIQLYEVSDKYGADAMKKQCADFLTDNLTPDNACKVLVLSDRHSDADFKKNVVEYVIREKLPYMGQKWTDFCMENLKLAVEVLNLFCHQFRPK